MVGTGKTLTVRDVVEINRRMISLFGGIFFEGDNNLANRGSLEYLLAEVHGEDFPGETFHVLKEKEIKQFGEYRTRRLASAASGGVG